jgi:CxxC-x17-CxxC domain-containing protein
MAFQEKTLTCYECGQSFAFTVEEQELFAQRGYTNEPKRCPTCRENRRNAQSFRGGYVSSGRAPREMFPAVCAQCGKATEVPFEPRPDRPVYCRDCYSRRSDDRFSRTARRY